MPETTAPADGQAPAAASGQVPGSATDQASGATPPTGDAQQESNAGDQASAAIASELAAMRAENARLRRENAGARTQLTAAQQASMSELERSQARVAELERANAEALTREQDRNVRLSAIEEATRLNFRSPGLAYRLLDRSEVEFDDGGTPKNVARLLKAILDADPYLGKGAGADFGGGNRGGSPAPDMNQLIRRAAGRNS